VNGVDREDLMIMDDDHKDEVADVPPSSVMYMQPDSFRGPAPGGQEIAGSNVLTSRLTYL
jgi:hypothetical protein